MIEHPPGPKLQDLLQFLDIEEGKELNYIQYMKRMGVADPHPSQIEMLQAHVRTKEAPPLYGHSLCLYGEHLHCEYLFQVLAQQEGTQLLKWYDQEGYLYKCYHVHHNYVILYLRKEKKIRVIPTIGVDYYYTYPWTPPERLKEEVPHNG